MKHVPPVHTGEYLRLASREKPPEELAAAIGMPIPPALQSAEKEEVIGHQTLPLCLTVALLMPVPRMGENVIQVWVLRTPTESFTSSIAAAD